MKKFEFSKTIHFEEKEIKEIEFDLESLSGDDVEAVKKEFTAAGNYAPVPSSDSTFCIMLLARAAKMPIEFFKILPAKDYLKLAQEVSNFLWE